MWNVTRVATCGVASLLIGSLLLLNSSFFGGKISISPQNCLQFGDVATQDRSASVPPEATCEALWEAKWASHQAYLEQLAHSESSRLLSIQDWNGLRAYDMYEPEWVCAAEVRVGPGSINIGDGPKFVCAPDMLKEVDDCLVYSIGSNYDFQFEEGIRKHAPNCEFHTFDGTLNLAQRALPPGLEEKNIHFHNWNLGVQSGVTEQGWQTKSIGDVLNELGHKGRRIHVFKIDCEGCEYQVMPQLAEHIKSGDVRIDQIQVEMHGVDASAIQLVFQSLRGPNFAVFHKERNHWGCQGYQCVEFSLISESRAKEVFQKERCINNADAADVEKEEPWWMKPYRKSVSKGPIQIVQFPYEISEHNDAGLVQLFCYAGGKKDASSTFIDIGLPTESIYFANAGYKSEAFEARKDGYDDVKKMIDGQGLQKQITLHNVALSNYSGETKIYEARDSSSILKSAVDIGPELQKRTEEGMKETIVKVAPLDEFITRADAMKIDTQGVEPEIYMGAKNVLNSGLPFPILMEYCSRLRNFKELSVGVHILQGMGYRCYARQAFTLDEHAEFCGDFYCAKELKDVTCN